MLWLVCVYFLWRVQHTSRCFLGWSIRVRVRLLASFPEAICCHFSPSVSSQMWSVSFVHVDERRKYSTACLCLRFVQGWVLNKTAFAATLCKNPLRDPQRSCTVARSYSSVNGACAIIKNFPYSLILVRKLHSLVFVQLLPFLCQQQHYLAL